MPKSALAPIAAMSVGFLFLYAALFTVAYIDFDRPEIRAACVDADPYALVLVLDMLSQAMPVVTLSRIYLVPSPRRLGINIGWLLLMAALLATTYLYGQHLRDQRQCLDEIYRPLQGQLSGTAGIMLTVGFFIILLQGILAAVYAILIYHDLRLAVRST